MVPLLFLALFWTAAALLTTINLLSFRRLLPARRSRSSESWPSVSIVIPARNEERWLGATLDAALQQDYPTLEVIVVDDCSTDGTAAVISSRSGHPRLRPVAGSEPPSGWLGKTHALTCGTAVASGEWLLLMDADVRLAPEALRQAVGYAEGRGLDHLALMPRFERQGFWEEVLMPAIAATFFIYSPSFLALSPRWRTLALGGGAFNLVRRSRYQTIGGHLKLANSVVDDIRLAVELKRAGFRTGFLLGDHLVRLRMYHGRREIVEGFTKNLHAIVQAFLGDHWLPGALAMLAALSVNLAPFLWIPWAIASPGVALSWSRLPLGLSLLLLLASRAAVQWRLRYPLWPLLFHPLLALVAFEIEGRALFMAYGEGVVRWRGREYPRHGTSF